MEKMIVLLGHPYASARAGIRMSSASDKFALLSVVLT